MKTIVFDLDDVLNDLNKQVEIELRKLGYEFDFKNVLTYNFNETLDEKCLPRGMTKDKLIPVDRSVILEQYNKVSILEKTTVPMEVVELIRELSKKYRICIHTLSLSSEVLEYKMKYLTQLFDGVAVTFSFALGEKLPYRDVYAVVEDCVENLACYSKNTKKFLLDKTYNQQKYNKEIFHRVGDYTRIFDVKEIEVYL